MIRKTFFCLGIVMIMVSHSCATIVRGTEKKIFISTEPIGASVEIFDSSNQRILKAITPTTVKLKKASAPLDPEMYRVKIAREGYKDAEFTIGNKVNVGAFIIGNFFLSFMSGIIIDGITGAMYNLIPSNTNGENMIIKKGDSYVKIEMVRE